MAFEGLQDKFSKIIKRIKGEHKLTEDNIEQILKEIRMALLEADVNFKVVRQFVSNIKEKCLGEEVLKELNPSEMVIKIVQDELTSLLGKDKTDLYFKNNGLTTMMLVGLQGSGKTTTCAKVASLMKNKLKKKVLLVSCDTYRLGAFEQLEELANKIGVDIVEKKNLSPLEIVKDAYNEAKLGLYDCLLIDTAGRLSIDQEMMDEINAINDEIKCDERLLVVDALSGQEALNVANAFNERVNLTGVVMTKMDSDTRGGAALSIAYEIKVGIKFIGTGEKIEDLDIFYPERMAKRILGMGDVLTFVEKVSEKIDEKEAEKSVKKMMSNDFTLVDMLDQMKQVNKLGSMRSLLKFIPGMPKITEEQEAMVEKEMKSFEAIINSMTPEERMNPSILKNSRKIRIAKGCGKTNADINRVLKKYDQMKEMMKQMKGKKGMMPPFNNFNNFK